MHPVQPTNTEVQQTSGIPPSCVVQKFGGTSLGKFSSSIVNNVIRPWSETSKVVAVCSARSLDTKLSGTTNRLLRACHEASSPAPAALSAGSSPSSSSSFRKILHGIETDHLQAVSDLITCPSLSASLSSTVTHEISRAACVLETSQLRGEVTPRCQDRVLCVGERLSALILQGLLRDRGERDAGFVDLSGAVDFPVATPVVLDQEFYNRLALRIGELVGREKGRVVVVTGFFGSVPGGLLNVIGRGYTDLCAALLAAAIGGAELQVWKEVDGIFTADPRRVREARLLSSITPAEAAELTFYGSEVIHPLAMKQAVRRGVPIAVKGVKNPKGQGSLVRPEPEIRKGSIGGESDSSQYSGSEDEELETVLRRESHPAHPVALTTKREIMVVRVESLDRFPSHIFLARVFSTLEKWGISADLISTGELRVSIALYCKPPQIVTDGDENHEITDPDVRGAVRDLRYLGRVELVPDMAMVSVIGRQIRRTVGLAGSILSTLGKNDICVEMISQGASDVSMSCVIEERCIEKAVYILHERFFPSASA